MKYQLLLLSLSFSFSLAAQWEELALDAQQVQEVPCLSDPTQMVLKYDNWSFYQSQDDTWSGDRDTGNCPNLVEGANQRYHLDLSTIDSEKAIFLAYEGPAKELKQNFIYSLYSSFGPDQNVQVKYGDSCPNGMCSGLIIRTEHSDELSSDTLRCNTFYPYTRTNQCDIFPCFNTEKTDRNAVVSAIYKLSLEAPSNETARAGTVAFESFIPPTTIDQTSVSVPEQFYNGQSYDITLSNLFSGWGTYLLTHNVPGLPSETNQSFTELDVEEFKGEPTEININLEWDVLEFQKYSHFIGAQVEESEPERHIVNLLIKSDMCISIVELIGTGGTNFKMDGGNIDFSDKEACIQVRDNSAIYIEEGELVHMGRDGVGNVNLRSGGSIVIKKDAELVFGGRLILTPYRPYEGEEKIHVDLQGGGHLEFTSDAKILNNIFGDELFLYVYMNGGTIDLSKLSVEDQSKVILVYPENEISTSELKLFPNPAQDKVTLYNKNLLPISRVEVYNNQGQLIHTKSINQNGPTLELNIEGLPTGLYTLMTHYGTEQLLSRIVIE